MRAESSVVCTVFASCERGGMAWRGPENPQTEWGEALDNAPPGLLAVSEFGKRSRLAGVKNQHDVAEERLKRPARGQVDADATSGLAHPGSEFEEACAKSFDLC
jgi:hypothetical protein